MQVEAPAQMESGGKRKRIDPELERVLEEALGAGDELQLCLRLCAQNEVDHEVGADA